MTHSLIRLVASGADFTGEYACNLLALGQEKVHALSCAGDHTAIRFLHAALREDKKRVKFDFNWEDAGRTTYTAEASYDLRIGHLGYDCWHLLAISDHPQFMLHDDHDTLWAMFRSERFTTPMLRLWVPQIAVSLRKDDKLLALTSLGCQAHLLTADSSDLDDIVSKGLKRRRLTIAAPQLQEAV